MLASKVTLCIASIVLLFVANRVHFDYNCGLRTLVDRFFDMLGIVTGIIFCSVLAYENRTLYVIPQIAFFISACMLVRYKTRKKFCLPFWKTAKIAIITFVICGGAGYTKEIVILSQGKENVGTIAMIIVAAMLIIISLVAVTNCIFGQILNRRRVSSYYY